VEKKTMKKFFFRRAIILFAGCFLWNISVGSCAALSLDDAIDMALKQNLDISVALRGEDTAAANLDAALGAQKFSVAASSSWQMNRGPNSSSNNTAANSIDLTLPIYTGGKNEATIDSKKYAVTQSQLNTVRTRETIILNTITAYYDILEAEKTVEVDQEAVDKYQAHLVSVQQLYSAGSEARVDVLSSEVDLSNAKQTLIKAKNTYEIDLSTLRNILRMAGDEPLKLTDDFSYKPFDQTLPDCLTYALSNRKDLQSDQLAVEVAEKSVTIAAAGQKAQVSTFVDVDWDSDLPSQNDMSYVSGISASWNLFDSNVTNANIKAAKIAVETAKLELAQAQETVDLAVRQAYLNMREAEERFVSTQDAVQKAEEDYYIASEKYKAGEGLMLDITDAQNSLSTAELNYISAQYDYARYKATLENTMGLSGGVNK